MPLCYKANSHVLAHTSYVYLRCSKIDDLFFFAVFGEVQDLRMKYIIYAIQTEFAGSASSTKYLAQKNEMKLGLSHNMPAAF